MRRMIWALCLSMAAVIPTAVTAGSCNPSIQLSSPTTRFSIDGENATDRQSGLVWKRCPLGYRFDAAETQSEPMDDGCEVDGETRFSWREALALVQDFNGSVPAGERADWRLPNIKELYSIIERQCVNPAINQSVFPQPPSTFIGEAWSGTYTPDLISGSRAYALLFGSGEAGLFLRTDEGSRFAVMLVRDL